MMGHFNGEYSLYNDSAKQTYTLHQLEAQFLVSDHSVLERLKRTVQSLFGTSPVHEYKGRSRESGWDGSGPGWKWDTDKDLAYLYMDKDQASENGEGGARFQLRRSPLHRQKIASNPSCHSPPRY